MREKKYDLHKAPDLTYVVETSSIDIYIFILQETSM